MRCLLLIQTARIKTGLTKRDWVMRLMVRKRAAFLDAAGAVAKPLFEVMEFVDLE